ncbi:hypothetical protein [Duganella sp. FT27W]|uniref:hypothetical protein n=1 Tax=Duganella sp. FT27W TaxID=2654636 RepID=UPI00128E3BDD|nr:hypothetical protein [Duganella sp. FT27W]MPQ56304.1 hypothetical protein [Duganella sp. FT27W]
MKILNLDKLNVSSGRFLTIANVRHEIMAMTVENFLKVSHSAQELISRTASPSEHFENVLDTIMLLVPTAPREALSKLSLDGLNTVSEFVRGADVDEAEVIEVSAEEGKAGN